jgi:transcriptional regulator with XRE-family HTH domain
VEDIKKLVGDRIRQLRKEQKLSQEELGDKSDLHYTHIGAIERGEVNWSIDSLVKVAVGLNVTVSNLLALPPRPADIRNLKKTILAKINDASPETLRLFSDIISGIKLPDTDLAIRRRSRNK